MNDLTFDLSARPFGAELMAALSAAEQAGDLVIRMRSTAASSIKYDGTIVTEADVAAANLIRQHLSSGFPADAILTEEDTQETDRLHHDRCWIVDPIDGTQQYAEGSDDFDVYIALSLHGRIVVGVGLQPTTGLVLAATEGGGALMRAHGTWSELRLAGNRNSPLIATRYWLGAPENLNILEPAAAAIGGQIRNLDSGIGIRSFLEGPESIDAAVALYVPGTEPQGYEWDLAVLDIVLREAGGAATGLDGGPIVFNKPDPRFPEGVILSRDPIVASRLTDALAG